MFDPSLEASFVMPEGLPELIAALEEEWPARSAAIRASGVPTGEYDPAGSEAAGGEPAGFEPAGGTPAGDEPAAPEEPAAAEPAAVEPPAPQFDPLEFEALQQRIAAAEAREEQLIAALSERMGAGEPQPAGGDDAGLYDEWGNIRPEALLNAVRTAAQEAVAPFREQITQAQAAELAQARTEHYGELVQGMIDDNIARLGDLASSPEGQETALELLEARAMQLLPALNTKYGTNPDGSARPGVLERAIEQAAGNIRELLGAHSTSALEQERNRLGELAGVHGEPGAGGGGASEAPVIKIGETSAAKFAASRQ